MGITQLSYELLKRTKLQNMDIKSVCELGSQNDYTTNEANPPFANGLYKRLGIDHYVCVDLAGDNSAIGADLSQIFYLTKDAIPHLHSELNEILHFDLVTDFGTSEHVVKMKHGFTNVGFHDGQINSIYPEVAPTEDEAKEGYYNCWLNKFNLCKENGIIISENPLTKNWPLHGYSYLGVDFYDELVKASDLEIIEQGLEAAMGNTTDGWNIWSVLKKTGNKFPSFDEFNKLPIFRE